MCGAYGGGWKVLGFCRGKHVGYGFVEGGIAHCKVKPVDSGHPD